MARRTGSTSKKTIKLDMRKAERGKKGGARYPEGEYKFKIVEAERGESNAGNTMIILKGELVEGPNAGNKKYKGKPLTDRLTLTEKNMFRVGWLLDACGIKWKNSVIDFPLNKVEGKTIGVQLYDDEYNNRISSKVSEYYSEEEVDDLLEGVDDEDEDEDEDEDDDDLDEDEDEDDEDEDDDEDDDEDEDEDEDDLEDLDLPELKKRARAAKVKGYKTMKRKALIAAIEEAEEDDDDDEDEL